MADGNIFDFSSPPSSVLDSEQAKLEAAYKQAMNQYIAAEKAMAKASAIVDDGKPYSMHDVSGLGRYVIPRISGWKTLLGIIHDPVPNIDFSANIYPNFDGIIGQHFQSPYLLDPLDNKYESYESLRDNLAAVRNYLMERYFAVDSTMSPAEAKKNMAEIAAFVGDGLYNNFLFGGVIRNHNPDKPHIDLKRAREKNGDGAQYIYECILAHNRHTSGFRPLDAIIEMFGGKKAPDWKLPDASKTHFTEMFHKDLAERMPDAQAAATADAAAAAAAAAAQVNAIQARLDAVHDAQALKTTASDLDNIGNYLVFTATHMEGVAQLDAPVRRRAVDIAKDILRNLKVTLGNIDITQGLNLKPSEDVATLGAIKGVAKVYERLLAWARSNNDTAIFQHPSVLAATRAIAQMGYIAKQEALRMANLAGDAVMAHTISEQLKLLPSSYIPKAGTKFGDLIDTIQNGMETILNRTQEVSVDGGQIGHSLDGDHGGAMSSIPAAGMGSQAGVYDAAGRNQQAMMAAELAAQADAQRINTQIASQARKQGQSTPPQAHTQSRSTTGRQALGTAQAAKKQQGTVSTSRVNPTAPLSAAQQQQANRANTIAGLAARRAALQHHQEEEHEHERLHNQQHLEAAKKATQAKAAAAKIDPNILKGFSMKGVTGAPIMAGSVPKPQDILAERAKNAAAANNAHAQQSVKTQPAGASATPHPDDRYPPVVQPVPPTRGGGRSH